VLLATSQASSIAKDDPGALKKVSEEIRLLLIAAMEVALVLADELGHYSATPLNYEKRWSSQLKTDGLIFNREWKKLTSEAFDLENLRLMTLATYRGTYARAEREGDLP
jgi:hypothetical protein